ncbi:hypothetical protein [Pseudomonas japonica]|uniref:Lipoprotein n=1 Tax=Pseudomonas japonica TaxID=256466 RepID=A0A239AAP8_9PSED|nr:hypothetical protein [Pseudomonas japonica]SNR92411.1 hypothetical protein SAMN05444352_101307 [Pseudomonas japonica]
MYRRLALLAVLGSLITACVPYGGSSYYRTDVYSADRYAYPGYYDRSYNRGYYVVPQPRRYYAPAPRYYPPAPSYHRPYPVPDQRYYDGRGRHDGPGRPGNRGWDRGRDRGNRDDWRGHQRQWGDRDGRERGRDRYH